MDNSVLIRNHVKISGVGVQPMIFAHGFGCDQQMWRAVVPFFEQQYKVITFDYAGHGNSQISSYNPERYSSLYGYAQDLIEIIAELNLSDVIFVGHSVSSMIGMLASIQNPASFSRLIMVGPSPSYLNDGDYQGGFERSDIIELLETMSRNYIGWSNFIAPEIMGNKDRPELGDELTNSFCSTDPLIARQFAEVTFLSDNRNDLSKSTVPALILQCSNDMIAPETVGLYLSKNLPNSTIYYMKASGHCPHVSAPDETVELIRQYLSKLN
ncbi:MAG: alpha/beta hydrolase [Chitinophagaceae bacterium]|nr:MAG: alpha/beta hydrolase [Chitinophagaceae bacterium]